MQELEEIDAVIRDAEGLRASERTALAFHDPKELGRERTRLQQRTGAMPPVEQEYEKAKAALRKRGKK